MSGDLKYQGMIAPCGMNCGLCIGHLRQRKPCEGCLGSHDANKPEGCRVCTIVACEHLAGTEAGFCYACPKYPCRRLKALDKRYSTKYGMSMFENLAFIQGNGLEEFLRSEEKKWTCPECGSGLSVHRDYCLGCQHPYR